jgi:hypothetical protein
MMSALSRRISNRNSRRSIPPFERKAYCESHSSGIEPFQATNVLHSFTVETRENRLIHYPPFVPPR